MSEIYTVSTAILNCTFCDNVIKLSPKPLGDNGEIPLSSTGQGLSATNMNLRTEDFEGRFDVCLKEKKDGTEKCPMRFKLWSDAKYENALNFSLVKYEIYCASHKKAWEALKDYRLDVREYQKKIHIYRYEAYQNSLYRKTNEGINSTISPLGKYERSRKDTLYNQMEECIKVIRKYDKKGKRDYYKNKVVDAINEAKKEYDIYENENRVAFYLTDKSKLLCIKDAFVTFGPKKVAPAPPPSVPKPTNPMTPPATDGHSDVSGQDTNYDNQDTIECIWPTKSRRIQPTYSGHQGVDISPVKQYTEGDAIYAFTDGVVSLKNTEYPDKNGNYANEGYTVRIHHINPLDNGYTQLRTQYMHLKSPGIVNSGESVKAGQIIGYMGSTGKSTGVHLHFETRVSNSAFPLGGTSRFYDGDWIDAWNYLNIAEDRK